MTAKSIAMRVLLASIPIAGVVLAVSVLIGGQDIFVISATAGYIFLADVYVVASLAARHRWLRIAIWVGTAIALTMSIIQTWVPETDRYIWSDRGVLLEKTAYGYLSSVSFSLHMGVATLILIAFFSFTYRFVRERFAFHVCYALAIGVGLCAWAVLSVEGILAEPGDVLSRIGIALVIIAVTLAAVVIVGAIVRATALKQVVGDPPPPLSGATYSGVLPSELESMVTRIVDERLRQLGVSPRE